MKYASCPTAIINAPIDIVWRLLTEPAKWGDFYDVRIANVVPPGRAVAGQIVHGDSGRWRIRFPIVFEFLTVDLDHHRLVFLVRMPFGISVYEDLDCVPV